MRPSELGVFYFRAGVLVWDDVLDHRQFPVTSSDLRLLADAMEGESVDDDILPHIFASIERADREALINVAWEGWNHLAKIYTLSSRMAHDDPVIGDQEGRQRIIAKEREEPPPPRFTARTSGQRIILPEALDLTKLGFVDVVRARRTARRFGQEPLSKDQLATVLHYTARVNGHLRTAEDVQYGNYYRCSPSGGARASTEVYLQVRTVDGVPSGNYRYLAEQHSLEYVSALSEDDRMQWALSGQGWFLQCSVLFVLTGDLRSTAWKYADRRSLRTVLLDAGHLNHSLYLAATAAGLAVGTTAVQRDEDLEEEFGIPAASEIVLMVSGIGPRVLVDGLAERRPLEGTSQ